MSYNILLFYLLVVFGVVLGDGGLLSPSQLEMFVDQVPDMPRIKGYRVVDGVPVSTILKITMFQKDWFQRLLQLAQESEKEMEVHMGLVQEELEASKAQAESETKRALEFERLLLLAQERKKEMEAHIGLVQEELEVSKSQVLEIQQKCTSQEAQISELTEALNLRKASEYQIKEDLLAKESQLEELKLKLQEEERAKVLIHDQLTQLTIEKETLDEVVVDLRSDLAQTKDHCSDLEAKLHLTTENLKAKEEELKSQEARLTLIHDQLTQVTIEKETLDEVVADLSSKLEQIKDHYTDLEAKLRLLAESLNDKAEKLKIQEARLTLIRDQLTQVTLGVALVSVIVGILIGKRY